MHHQKITYLHTDRTQTNPELGLADVSTEQKDSSPPNPSTPVEDNTIFGTCHHL